MSQDSPGPGTRAAPPSFWARAWRATCSAVRHARRPDRRGLSVLASLLMLAVVSLPLLLRPAPNRAPRTLGVTGTDERAAVEALILRVLAKYEKNLERFDTNLKLQAAFIILGLLVLVRRSDTLKFAGTELPLKWLHWLVPLILLYLWLVFGFLLDDLIEGRHQGYELLGALGRRDVQAQYERIFHDAGLIDGWFVSFVERPGSAFPPSIQDGSFTTSTSLFLLCVLGVFVASGHAIILSVLRAGTRRYLLCRRGMLRSLSACAPVLGAAALLAASHLQFAYGGANPNWLQPAAGILAAVAILLLSGLARKSDREVGKRRRDAARALSPGPASPGGSGA